MRISVTTIDMVRGCGMHQFVKSSNELLRKLGYRLTPQRYMILSVIQEASEHLTIDQITERVQQRNPYVSLSTVYRTLELLKKLDLIRENRLSGEQSYYEAADGQVAASQLVDDMASHEAGPPRHQDQPVVSFWKFCQYLDGVGPRWPWYLEPMSPVPYGVAAGSVSCTKEIWPIFISG